MVERGPDGRFVMGSADERFMAKVIVDPNTGCWLWTGKLTNGYARFCLPGGQEVPGSRFAWESRNGPIPEGLQMDHFVCENPPCVNPHHVRPVTPRENTLRGNAPPAWNRAKTHCIRGHELAGDNLLLFPEGRRCRICRMAKHAEAERRRRARLRAVKAEANA